MKEISKEQKKEIENFKQKILWNREGNLDYDKETIRTRLR